MSAGTCPAACNLELITGNSYHARQALYIKGLALYLLLWLDPRDLERAGQSIPSEFCAYNATANDSDLQSIIPSIA